VASITGDRADHGAAQPAAQVTQVAMADEPPANLPDELKNALTPENARPAIHAVTASAQITGPQAQQLVAQLNAGHGLTSADAQARTHDTLIRP
ncbi:MAG: hypothetical protein ACXU8O_00730, partial [Asticcacaulis sp.]